MFPLQALYFLPSPYLSVFTLAIVKQREITVCMSEWKDLSRIPPHWSLLETTNRLACRLSLTMTCLLLIPEGWSVKWHPQWHFLLLACLRSEMKWIAAIFSWLYGWMLVYRWAEVCALLLKHTSVFSFFIWLFFLLWDFRVCIYELAHVCQDLVLHTNTLFVWEHIA